MMNEKIKNHFIKHKEAYIVGVSGVIVSALATYTCCKMRGRHADVPRVSDEGLITERSVVNEPIIRSLNLLSKNSGNHTNVVAVVEKEGRGHPGYLVKCLETGEILSSQQQMANKFGIPESVLSDHLRGRFDNANGLHFERLNVAA